MSDNRLPAEYAGSQSTGTTRPEDLAVVILRIMDDAAELGIIREGYAEDLRASWEDADESERADVLASLFDEVQSVAPEGTVFGTHEGDGADFGFWYVLDPWEDSSENS